VVGSNLKAGASEASPPLPLVFEQMGKRGCLLVPRLGVGKFQRKRVAVVVVGEGFPNSQDASRFYFSGRAVELENERVTECPDRAPQPFLRVLV
jgi:hypothetical protein